MNREQLDKWARRSQDWLKEHWPSPEEAQTLSVEAIVLEMEEYSWLCIEDLRIRKGDGHLHLHYYMKGLNGESGWITDLHIKTPIASLDPLKRAVLEECMAVIKWCARLDGDDA